MNEMQRAWVAKRTTRLVEDLIGDAPVLGLTVSSGPGGTVVIDCGVSALGSWEAGRRIAVLAHGGMMEARLGVTAIGRVVLPEFVGDSWSPAESAYGLQVSFPLDEVDPAIRISGPIRGLAGRDGAASERPRDDRTPWGVAVVESDALPGVDAVEAIAARAELRPADLTLIVVPTASPAGATQIAGRLNESVLFTWCESLGLDAGRVLGIVGAVPIAPVGRDRPTGVTEDDMIHYAGRVTVLVAAAAGWNLDRIAERLTFGSSPAHGRLFSELLAEAGGVFESIPGLVDLNKVAQVTLVDRVTGRTAIAGAVEERILADGMAAERRDA